MPNLVISIIDDDPAVREGTIDLLNSAGFAAETFTDADEFLKSGRVDDASCVVADMRMRGMCGLELHDHLLSKGGRPRPRARVRRVLLPVKAFWRKGPAVVHPLGSFARAEKSR